MFVSDVHFTVRAREDVRGLTYVGYHALEDHYGADFLRCVVEEEGIQQLVQIAVTFLRKPLALPSGDVLIELRGVAAQIEQQLVRQDFVELS